MKWSKPRYERHICLYVYSTAATQCGNQPVSPTLTSLLKCGKSDHCYSSSNWLSDVSLLLRQERDKDMVLEEKRLKEVKKEVETEDSKLKKVFFQE